ncbi:SDR family oxidoreductase [Natrialba asiatica]|uniref:Oxidoreductase n=1 Tax=Natrialba asiatica (strain ATCC 700177 / DSM 12278 / JCM 9576 / FERM P-10747 / NBRC 102637 / 172P1) TaxID=29540 RepID=M0AVC0_NATA1|nr:SDR family oxidoreductase [Natrialba asiatica]ELZ02636.1 oxidoreductase [Natrialba asiatica DSM 12278]
MAPTVLITGCSSGIGRAAARTFLADGWDVWATARDPDALADLEANGATTERLDVTSTADAERVVDRLVAECGRLDCLINNAGFSQMGPVEDVPVEKVRDQYEVNTFGPHRLVRAALPSMRARGEGRIINVTSITDRFPIAGTGVYSGSKSALASTTRALRQEVREHGIDVIIVEPTVVATTHYDRTRDELVDVDHKTAYTDLYELHEQLHTIKSGGPGITSPEAVAETMLEAATVDDPKRRYAVGWTATVGAVIAAAIPESWRTPLIHAGVRAATSPVGNAALRWWFARHHRPVPPDESDRSR